jgi:hypothetical protein
VGLSYPGESTLVVAELLPGSKNKFAFLFTLNLLLSLVSLVWTIIDPVWVETTLGLVLYFTWNVLMIIILVMIFQFSKKNSSLFTS